MVALTLAGIMFNTQTSIAQFYAPIFGGLVGSTATYYFIRAKDISKETRMKESVAKFIKSELVWYSDLLKYFIDNGSPTQDQNLLTLARDTPHYQRYRDLPQKMPSIYHSISFDTKLQNLEADTIIMLDSTYHQLEDRLRWCVYFRDPTVEFNKERCYELIDILQTAECKL